MLLVTLAVTLALPVTIDLDAISTDYARTLHGRRALAKSLIAKTSGYSRSSTSMGVADRPDIIVISTSNMSGHVNSKLNNTNAECWYGRHYCATPLTSNLYSQFQLQEQM